MKTCTNVDAEEFYLFFKFFASLYSFIDNNDEDTLNLLMNTEHVNLYSADIYVTFTEYN